MTFKESVFQDLGIFFGDFAEILIYRDSSGASKDVPAIFLTKTDLLLENMNGIESSIPAVLVKKSDVPDIRNGDIFTINGANYKVIQTEYNEDLIIKAYLSLDNRPLLN